MPPFSNPGSAPGIFVLYTLWCSYVGFKFRHFIRLKTGAALAAHAISNDCYMTLCYDWNGESTGSAEAPALKPLDCLMTLTTPVEGEVTADPQQHLLNKLKYLERNLCKVANEVCTAADNSKRDRCLLELYEE